MYGMRVIIINSWNYHYLQNSYDYHNNSTSNLIRIVTVPSDLSALHHCVFDD